MQELIETGRIGHVRFNRSRREGLSPYGGVGGRLFGGVRKWLCIMVLPGATVLGTGQAHLEMRDGYLWDPQVREYFIARGIAYQTWNPPVFANQSLEQVDYDLTEFKKLHANSVRVDLAWRELEPREGVYDWTKPDHLVRKARELGLRLFVLIGYQYPPDWFPAEWRGLNVRGEISNVLNYQHPEARRAYARHLTAVTERYREEGAIGAWILGNEYAFFDLWESLEPGEGHRMLGYDAVSLQHFRAWLEASYAGEISRLNHNWAADYEEFGAVEMPWIFPQDRDAPAFHDLLQWRKQCIADFVALGAVAVRGADPDHLITYSMVGLVYSTDDDNNTCEDAKAIVTACRDAGAPLNFWSINNYGKSKLGSELRAADFGIAKYQAQSGLPLMVSETGYSDTENHYSGAALRHAKAVPSQLWEALMSGAIGVHLFHWSDRDSFAGDFVRERGFGIVRQNRTPKQPVYDSVLDGFRRMAALPIDQLLGGSRDPMADVQFLWSTNSDMGWPRANYENANLWGALKRLGYQPGIIDDEQFAGGASTNAAVLLLSRCYQMESGQLDRIARETLSAGVHVHANADLPGQFNAYHQANPGWAEWMREIFGLEVGGAWTGLDGGVTGVRNYERVSFQVRCDLEPLVAGERDYLDTWKVWHGVRASDHGVTVITHTGVGHTQEPTPALVLSNPGMARTAINMLALGDTTPIWKEESPYTHEWDVRYAWLQAIYRTHFGLRPSIELEGGRGAHYVIPDFRICRDGSVLIALLNEDTNQVSVVVSAPGLIAGRQVENLTSGGIVTRSTDGRLAVPLAGDGYVLLYAYERRDGTNQSLLNPSPHKLWFESAPSIIWTGRSSGEIEIGCDTEVGLRLHVDLESRDARRRVYARSEMIPVAGREFVRLQLMVPGADLTDDEFVSTADGGEYTWHAWLEQEGRVVSEQFLPVRLAWGVRPLSLPTAIKPGKTTEVTLIWEELPELEHGEAMTPLDRTRLWESLKACERYYGVTLELHSGGKLVASAGTITRAGTDRHVFKVNVPVAASGPFTWVARVQSVESVRSRDLEDSFEGRTLGALTRELANDPNAESPLAPWESYHYPAGGVQQWFDEGVTQAASHGSQAAFLILNNPAPPLGYSGFGIRRVFEESWPLPPNADHWSKYSFACDFRLRTFQPCLLELQVRNTDPTGDGHWIQFVQRYQPGPDGWQTIRARLDQFRAPRWPHVWFDSQRVAELVVNVRMEAANALYEANFDNIRFDGPEDDAVLGRDFATYRSAKGQPDYLAFRGIEHSPTGGVHLSWPAQAGRVYQVLYIDGGLVDPLWKPLAGAEAIEVAVDGMAGFTDEPAGVSSTRFYRLVLLPSD